MSKTTKVVLIVTAVMVICIIGAAVTFGVMYNGGGPLNLKNIFSGITIDVDEKADFDLDGVTRLNIENVSGRIYVKTGEAHATLTGRIVTNKEQEEFLSVKNEGGTLTVRSDIDTIYPQYVNGDMVLTVYLPADLGLDTAISGASASAQIDGIRFGKLSVNSASGSVDINNCAGSTLNINVVSGEVNAAHLVFESVAANTTSGGVTVDGVSGSVNAGSVSGTVRVSNAAGSVDISNTSGNASVVQSQEDVQPIRIHNISGSINVALNPNAAFMLNVNSTSGSFNTDFDITVSGKLSKSVVGEDIEGAVNGGGSAVELSTVSGGISVTKSK